MNTVVLLLGSNVGERLINLENACKNIEKELGKITGQSSMYETEAWGNTEQESFLNMVVKVDSSIQAQQAMERIIRMEEAMGRVRTKKWEPRIIDIDILFYNDEIISSENLVVPHSGLHQRKFTLVPLAEIMPGYIHPILKKSIAELLEGLNDSLDVKKISPY
jgi:2-amino-4-hydroxy-6-hydroxymethyldihydropteridine diphosphokinase